MGYLSKSGLQILWTQILNLLKGKVDVVDGKGLSTNDYTTEEKEKLAELSSVVVKQINFIDGSAVAPNVINYYGSETMQEIVDMLRNPAKYDVTILRMCILPNNVTNVVKHTNHTLIHDDSNNVIGAKIFYGDDLRPVILDIPSNKIIFDSDWVSPSEPEKYVMFRSVKGETTVEAFGTEWLWGMADGSYSGNDLHMEHVVIDNNEGIVINYDKTGYEVISLAYDSNSNPIQYIVKFYFGDNACPVIVDLLEQEITLDPNWVAPEVLPETSEAHQMLVTDGEGNKVWEDRSHYIETITANILAEESPTYNADLSAFLTTGTLIYDFVVDGIYTVVWNGVTYTTKCVEIEGISAIGNIGALSGDESLITEDPFVIFNAQNINPDLGKIAMIAPMDGSTELTISIDGTFGLFHKIDTKYLPEEVNSNLINGSAIGSLRSINANIEHESYTIGKNALAIGLDAQASGEGAIAIGTNANAVGNNSYSEGSSQAEGEYSHAESRGLTYGDYSHAENNGDTHGNYSHAEGNGSAYGDYSHAENNGKTYGRQSHAEGHAESIGEYSHAEGKNTVSKGDHAHSEGYHSITLGMGSHAEGCGKYIYTYLTGEANATTYTYEVNGSTSYIEEGYYIVHNDVVSKIISKTDTTITVETTLSDNAITRSYVYIYNLIAVGEASHVEGKETIALGICSHAEGKNTKASGEASHAEGNTSISEGTHSHAEGFYSIAHGSASHAEGEETIAKGIHGSHAEGWQSIAHGNASHAEGYKNKAIGDHSHAEGNSVIAYGWYSHAEGQSSETSYPLSGIVGEANALSYTCPGSAYFSKLKKGCVVTVDNINYSVVESIDDGWTFTVDKTLSAEELTGVNATFWDGVAVGRSSHAEGFGTIAYSDHSHAEGYSTRAYGNVSHAEGWHSITSGYASHAEGSYTIANGEFQHTEGKFNIEDNDDRYAHIVGNGAHQYSRSNAHTLDWSGNAWYQGDVYTGGTSQDDAERLAKVSEITAPRDHLALTDKVTGKVYEITIENGNLIATLVEGDE